MYLRKIKVVLDLIFDLILITILVIAIYLMTKFIAGIHFEYSTRYLVINGVGAMLMFNFFALLSSILRFEK